MDAEFALSFAEEWVAAWNSHDLDRILTHYADDVVFSSPHIVRRLGKSSGEVCGQADAAVAVPLVAGTRRRSRDRAIGALSAA